MSHIPSTENVAAIVQSTRREKQKTCLDEAGFSVGQGLDDLDGRGLGQVGGKSYLSHFLPPLFLPSKPERGLD